MAGSTPPSGASWSILVVASVLIPVFWRNWLWLDPNTPHTSLADDYRLLGVADDAADAEIKKAYRRLMNRHHPDKLIAKGMPEEMVRIATEKTQQIQTGLCTHPRVPQTTAPALT